SLRVREPLEADWMRLRGVRSVDKDDVGVLDVTPVVRHRSSSECGGQTDHRWAVSDPSLLFYMHDAERPHQLRGEVALFAAECGAAGEGDSLGAIHDVAVRVLRDERVVARRFDVLREPVEHEVPGLLFPL